MVRTLGALCVLLALTGCKANDTAQTTTSSSVMSSQSSNDTRVAKEVFGHIPTPSSGTSEAIGSYARGCQSGAMELPENGQTWQAMRLSRNRNWGQPQLVSFVEDLSAFAATQPGWDGLYVGDMSQPRGGPMLTGHASHQIGLDVDIWMLPPSRLDLSEAERENLSSISMQRSSGAYVNSDWSPQHEAILRRAAEDPRVARIFVFAGAKVEMCKNATGNRDWLRKIRPWWGHHYHFHVRLNCPAGDDSCQDQAPIPAGDGCADAQVWVDNILNPPPPSDEPPAPPRGPLRMNDLPDQCGVVAGR
jgi:penicillin-insensitive murein endopeptidase